ncbi:hypothetical protein CEP54_010104 [Fusarium duplospermum]|uniref:Uncharacterized protein n=1 Tax=Fusarium duplospermum TaxID=1325734 RepID=A0A428PM37_9HYPO|nr:hypothetical protein CEP54_010104 [Fusarium duplospermum]
MTNLSAHVDDFGAMAKSMQAVNAAMGTKYMWGLDGMKLKDLDEGVATHVFSAFDPTIAEQNGEEVYPWATNKVSADMLWKLSERLVGQEFCY